MLAEALEASRRLSELAGGLAEENARLRARDAERDAEFERMRADLAVLQRMLFGRSSGRTRPETPGGGDSAGDGGSAGGGDGAGASKGVKRGPGARAGRRDYSRLPGVEVTWDFPGGGYCCPECGEPFSPLGSHVSGEQLDWRVSVRGLAATLSAHDLAGLGVHGSA